MINSLSLRGRATIANTLITILSGSISETGLKNFWSLPLLRCIVLLQVLFFLVHVPLSTFHFHQKYVAAKIFY